MLQAEKLIYALNDAPVFMRKKILKLLVNLEKTDKTLIPVEKKRAVLNFASNYYYSLFSPSQCAYTAYRSGVKAVGVNDYASLKSAKEFKRACDVLNISSSVGYHAECEPLFNEKQASCYTYGVPYNRVKSIENALEEIRLEKKERVEALINKINSRLKKYKITISLLEVLMSSEYAKGGAVTEKHVAKVLAKKLTQNYKTGEEIINFLTNVLKILVPNDEKDCLLSSNNKYYIEDLTRVIYHNVHVFKAGETLFDSETLLSLDKLSGGITAYKLRFTCYNEEFLLKAVEVLKSKNFNAVCFDDAGFSLEETNKITTLFLNNGLLPIAVNRMGMPRQVVEATEMNDILYHTALAVIGNGYSASCDVADGIFGENTVQKCPDLRQRIEIFKNIIEA